MRSRMATIKDRVQSFFRSSRVGKYNPNTIAEAAGILSLTKAGSHITESNAMALSTVYACVYKIATTIASLGLDVYESSGNEVHIANVHPAHDLIKIKPNAYQTAFEFWETITASALIYGMGYAIIERDDRGYAIALHPVHASDVDLREVKKEKVYIVKDFGAVRPENMLEIANLQRMSPIRLHRDNLGLARSAQDFGAEYFGQSGQMTGVLTSDQPLKKEQMDMIQGSWNHGAAQAGTKLMPFGFKYQRISISPDEAQFIETRKFQAEEICRIYNCPPAMVMLESQTTYNNVEQQSLMYARHTIVPWTQRIEQEIDRKLIPAFQRPEIYSKFRLEDLQRGDSTARANYFTQMLQAGVLSINEVRQDLELNPVDGGNVHLCQVNQISLDKIEDYSASISKIDTPNE